MANISKSLAIYFRFIWFLTKFLTHFGTICMLFGQVFIAVNGQILKTHSGNLVTLVKSRFFLSITKRFFSPLSSQMARLVMTHVTSVTKLGDLLDFGQFFKAFGNN